MREPFIPVNSRIPQKLWKDLHEQVFSKANPEAEFANFSESLRYFADLGLKAKALMSEVENPEFLKELEGLRDSTKQYEILESMDKDSRSALALALEMVEKHKWEQKKFV